MSGGNLSTISEAIDLIARLIGREVAVEHLPAGAGETRRSHADVTAARKQLGYNPQVGLEEGLRRQIAADAPGRHPVFVA